MFKINDIVKFKNPMYNDTKKDYKGAFKIIGFYKFGELVDYNPSEKTENLWGTDHCLYSVKVKSMNTGKELNTYNTYLELVSGK